MDQQPIGTATKISQRVDRLLMGAEVEEDNTGSAKNATFVLGVDVAHASGIRAFKRVVAMDRQARQPAGT